MPAGVTGGAAGALRGALERARAGRRGDVRAVGALGAPGGALAGCPPAAAAEAAWGVLAAAPPVGRYGVFCGVAQLLRREQRERAAPGGGGGGGGGGGSLREALWPGLRGAVRLLRDCRPQDRRRLERLFYLWAREGLCPRTEALQLAAMLESEDLDDAGDAPGADAGDGSGDSSEAAAAPAGDEGTGPDPRSRAAARGAKRGGARGPAEEEEERWRKRRRGEHPCSSSSCSDSESERLDGCSAWKDDVPWMDTPPGRTAGGGGDSEEARPTREEWGRPALPGGRAARPPTAAACSRPLPEAASEPAAWQAHSPCSSPPLQGEPGAGPPPETSGRDCGGGVAGRRGAGRVPSRGAGSERPPHRAEARLQPPRRPPRPRLAGAVAELKQDCGYLRLLEPERLFFFFKNDVRGVREGSLAFGDLRVGQRASFVGSKGWDSPGCPVRPRAKDVEVQGVPTDSGDSGLPAVPVGTAAVEGTGTPERRSLGEGAEGGRGAREDGPAPAASTRGRGATARAAEMPLPAKLAPAAGAEPGPVVPEPRLAPGSSVGREEAGKGEDAGREGVPKRNPIVWRPNGANMEAAELPAQERGARLGAEWYRGGMVTPQGLEAGRTIRVTFPDKAKAPGPFNFYNLLYKTQVVPDGERDSDAATRFARDAKEQRTVAQNLATFGVPSSKKGYNQVIKQAKSALARHFLRCGKVRTVWIETKPAKAGRPLGAYVEFETEEGRDAALAQGARAA